MEILGMVIGLILSIAYVGHRDHLEFSDDNS